MNSQPAPLSSTVSAFRQSRHAAIVLAADAPRWTVLDVNDAYLEVTRRTRVELVGAALFEAFPESSATTEEHGTRHVEASLTAALGGGHVVLPVQRYDLPVAGDPEVFEEHYWEMSSRPLRGDLQHIVGVLHEVENVTDRERKAAERRRLALELEEQQRIAETARGAAEGAERQLQTVLAQAPAAIAVTTGPEHRFLLANRGYDQLVGRVVAPGRTFREELPEIAAQGYEALLDRVYSTGEPYVAHEAFARVDMGGPELEDGWFDFVYQPLTDASGAVTGVLQQGINVTAHVVARNELLGANQQLQEQAIELEAQTEELQVATDELHRAADELTARTVVAESARRQAEESERRFRRMADVAPVLLWTSGVDAKCDWFNEPWLEFTGRTMAEELGDGWVDSVHPDDTARCVETYLNAFQARTPFVMEYRLRHRDGSYRWVFDHGRPRFAPDRVFAGYIGSCVDVTEQRRARAEAEAARDRLAKLQALTVALSGAASYNDIARAAVAHASTAFGAGDTLIAQLSSDGEALEIMGPGDLADAIRTQWERIPLTADVPIAEVARTREPIFLESRTDWAARFPDLVPLLAQTGHHANMIAPVLVGDRLLGVLAFAFSTPRQFSDDDRSLLATIAEQCGQALDRARLLESERAARAQAEAANRAKSEFLTVMSHELRTPLNAIDGYAALIELGIRGPVTPEQREDLARVRKSQRHLLGLVNEVLNYSRIEAGKVHYATDDVRVDEVLTTCESLVAPQAHAKGLTIRVLGSDPAVQARADADKVQQVVLNLLTNAIKFTERGGIIEMRCAAAADRLVHVMIADNGHGIPEDQLSRVFEPFVQIDSRLTRTQDGVGLGLAISRDLARGMGGDLTVASAVGEGSTFTLALPAA